jgi:thiol-disulfide isomerase/thioredoxin
LNIDDILKDDIAVAIYFSGKNCGVCHVLQPKIKELLETNFPKIKYYSFDAQEEQLLAASLNVFSVPTLLIYFDKKEFIRKSRNISIPLLEDEISRPYNMIFS